ncbi:MAG: peptidoglycan-associated lipoprotein Pal [Hydrogenophaga sp.]
MQYLINRAPHGSSKLGAKWATRLATLGILAALGACSSGVKLDEAKVEDRSAIGTAGQGGVGSAVDPRAVTGVQVTGSETQQPNAMARILYFDYDSFEVRAEYASTLEANARYLKANTTRRVALEGHTDESGGREYNLALGQKRAEAVRRSLSLLGVSEAQMEPVSFGEEKPAAVGGDEASMAKNRRVELTYR